MSFGEFQTLQKCQNQHFWHFQKAKSHFRAILWGQNFKCGQNLSFKIVSFFKYLSQIYVGAESYELKPTQPLTTNLPPGLLSFFNFLLSLQLLAWRISCSNQFKQEKIGKVKTELQLRQQKQSPIWISPAPSHVCDLYSRATFGSKFR